MRRHFIPSASGDFRLEADGEGSMLLITDPAPDEIDRLMAFIVHTREKNWTPSGTQIEGSHEQRIHIAAPVAAAATFLAPEVCSGRGTLTVLQSSDGKVVATMDGTNVEAAEAKATAPADTGVTVRRHTPCCPTADDGPLDQATEVLKAFCSPTQWKSWTKCKWLTCKGGRTGHWYRIAHRHSLIARRQTRICWDLTNDVLVHFHDSFLPPPEEVLSAKLILEHREPWLRNTSTIFGADAIRASAVFPEPFGFGYRAGTADSAFFSQMLPLLMLKEAGVASYLGGILAPDLP